MLNDLSTYTRWSLFGQALGPAIVIGAGSGAVATMDASSSLTGLWVMIAVGFSVVVAWAVTAVVVVRRADARLWREVAVGSEELAGGAARPVRVPARLVRSRIRRGDPAFTAARGRIPGPAVACAFTMVGAGRPRRVAALLPGGLGIVSKGTPAVLLVHPERSDVAVLDDRVTRDELALAAADPRFAGPDVPTDRTVVGGWSMLVVAFAAGFLCGLAIGAAGAILLG